MFPASMRPMSEFDDILAYHEACEQQGKSLAAEAVQKEIEHQFEQFEEKKRGVDADFSAGVEDLVSKIKKLAKLAMQQPQALQTERVQCANLKRALGNLSALKKRKVQVLDASERNLEALRSENISMKKDLDSKTWAILHQPKFAPCICFLTDVGIEARRMVARK